MQSIRFRHFVLWCASVLMLSIASIRVAQACDYVAYYPGYEFYTSSDSTLSNVPVDGRWGFRIDRGVQLLSDGRESLPELIIEVLDEDGTRVPGEHHIVPYGSTDTLFNVRREQVFVSWIPHETLRPNHTYSVRMQEDYYPSPDKKYDWEHADRERVFHTGEDTLPESTEVPEFTRVEGKYIESEARNMSCRERRPCTDGCGCNTYRWSTRFDWVPQVRVDIKLPTDMPSKQIYTTLETEEGTILDLIWKNKANVRRTYWLARNLEPPYCLTANTYLLGDTVPLASEQYCLTDADFEERGEPTSHAESAPRACKNSTIASDGTGAHAMPSSGCHAAPNPAPPAYLWAWVLLLVGGLRLRRRERVE